MIVSKRIVAHSRYMVVTKTSNSLLPCTIDLSISYDDNNNNNNKQQYTEDGDKSTAAITASEFILIHGENGFGKSALVRHFFMNHNQPLQLIHQQDRCCFCIKGEMDQRINLRAPNATFIDAFTSYVHQIKERKLLDHFHKLLQQSSITKVECNVLTQMIPSMADLFDREPKTTSSSSSQVAGTQPQQQSDVTTTAHQRSPTHF